MRVTRPLVIGCAFVLLTACDTVIGPRGSPGARGNSAAAPAPAGEALQGVVETAEDRFALRQPHQLVMLVCDDGDALKDVVGKEVIVYGAFMDNGDFAVSSLQVPDREGEPETFRVPAKPSRGERTKQ